VPRRFTAHSGELVHLVSLVYFVPLTRWAKDRTTSSELNFWRSLARRGWKQHGWPCSYVEGHPCVALMTPKVSLVRWSWDPCEGWVEGDSSEWCDSVSDSYVPYTCSGSPQWLISLCFPYAGRRRPMEKRLAWLTRSPALNSTGGCDPVD